MSLETVAISQEEIFQHVLGYAEISPEFYEDVLVPHRVRNFRSACGQSKAQLDNIESFAAKSEDSGLIAESLQFLKLLEAAAHFVETSEILFMKDIPWGTFTQNSTLDLIDVHLAALRVQTTESRIKMEESGMSGLAITKPDTEEVIDLTGGRGVDLGYAKKSLKAFSDIKFPAIPVKMKELKMMNVLFKNVMRSMNIEYLLDTDYKRPESTDPKFQQFEADNKFLFSALVQILSNPDHEARLYILSEEVENDGQAAWTKLTTHYKNESIQDNAVETVYNKWMNLRLAKVHLGACRTYITIYAEYLQTSK